VVVLIVLTVVVGGLVGVGLTEFARRGSGGRGALPGQSGSRPSSLEELDVELAVREHLYGERGRSP